VQIIDIPGTFGEEDVRTREKKESKIKKEERKKKNRLIYGG